MTDASLHIRPLRTGRFQSDKDDQQRRVWKTYWPPETASRAKDYLTLFLQAAQVTHITIPDNFVFSAGQLFFHNGDLQEVR